MSGILISQSLSRSIMIPVCHVRIGLAGVRALVWLPVVWNTGRDWLK